MFEGVLYFVLGFLASALIALMISPAIWNRAVVLTKRRIESSVPLTLNEVQADKDQLRAEFAMSTRRLEMSVEELQDKASRQVIEINRKRDELAKLAEESREKIRMVEELESRSADLRAKLGQREEQLAQTAKELEQTRAGLDAKAHEFEEMQRKFHEAKAEADSRRIELVAKQTNLDEYTDRTSTVEAERVRLQQETNSLRTAIARLESDVSSAEKRYRDTEERLARATKLNTELEERLQGAERNVNQLRSSSQTEDDSSNELTRMLMDERKKTTRLEADLAKATLRMEAILSDASNENVSKAMTVLNKEKADLRKELKAIARERDDLEKRLSNANLKGSAEWESERRENAVLRERINDLAAQVTAMTAAIEGEDSPIHDILRQVEKGKAKEGGNTLADRVRALQETARIKQAN